MTDDQATAATISGAPRPRAGRFLYEGFDIEPASNRVVCSYLLDDRRYRESVVLPAGGDWGPAAQEAARLVFLLSGVSYYKAGAPDLIDLGRTPIRAREREFLSAYYRNGLGEFAFRNRIDVQPSIVGGAPAGPAAPFQSGSMDPLVPFGGGLDSVVTVEMVRRVASTASLFIAASGDRSFSAIDAAAKVSGLPVVRAGRYLDPEILRPSDRVFNGHVPITGILSAIAVLAAVLGGHDAVVMSNEWSASVGNLRVGRRKVNHQWSKSLEFEDGFRDVLEGGFARPPDYFSLLRSASTLSIARRFAALPGYHGVFRSCNRSFRIDPQARLAQWCGECDKCCFVDLVLAPFMRAEDLDAVFSGREPLNNPDLMPQFRTLVGISGDDKPFECVGDVQECRVAAELAAARADRAGNGLLAELSADSDPPPSDRWLKPLGRNNVPEPYAPAADLD